MKIYPFEMKGFLMAAKTKKENKDLLNAEPVLHLKDVVIIKPGNGIYIGNEGYIIGYYGGCQ